VSLLKREETLPMPIVRADVPNWLTREQMMMLRAELRGCIERTWAKAHIWIAVREMYSEPSETTVIMTVDLRDGRGQEKERTHALFDQALQVCNRIIGTTSDSLILLVRKFEQDECVSGGDELPPLSQLTPKLYEAGDGKTGRHLGRS
jgi:hypothetical protein